MFCPLAALFVCLTRTPELLKPRLSAIVPPAVGVNVVDTPLTVLTIAFPEEVSALLLMMLTPVPVTPLTEVVNVFVLEALLTVVLLFNNVPKLTVEDTPLTLDTRFPPVAVKLLLLIIGTAVDVTPLTDVVRLFALEVFDTVVLLFNKLGRLTDELTPLTLEVSCPEATLNVLVVLPLRRVGRLIDEDTPFTVLTKLPPDVLSALLLMMFTELPVTPFTVVVNVFVLEALLTVVLLFNNVPKLKDEDTPLTVLTRLPLDVLSALLLMIFTELPVTPLTEVVKLFALEVLLTVVLLFNNVPRLTDELTPFTLDTKFPPVAVKLLLLMIGAAVDVTPLTATVILLADDVRLLLLMIDTAAAVTPFTEVVKLFALEVLDTVVLLFNNVPRLTDELTPFTLDTKFPPVAVKLLLLIIGTAVDVTPLTFAVRLLADDVKLLLLMIDTAVAVTPLTEVVKLFALEVLDTVVLLFSKLDRLTDELTPFTVLTRLPPDVLSALLLMMLTPVPVTPLTVVVNVFVLEAFDTVVAEFSTVPKLKDEDTPFTVLTRFPPDVLSALLLMMFTALPVTPLTVVVNVFVLEALLTVVLLFNNVPKLTVEDTPFTLDTKFPPVAVKLLLLIIGTAVDVTPLTFAVRLLADDVKLLLLIIGTAAAVTPLTEVVKLFALEVLDTVVLLFNKLGRLTDEVTPLTLEVSCPDATLNALVVLPLSRVGRLIDEDTPLTVLTRLPPDVLSALLLMMFTPVPVTPFTVVVSVFVLEAFDTVVGIELALNCLTTPVASATRIWSEPLPVCSPSRRKGLEVAFTCSVLLGALVLIPMLPAGEARLPFMPVPKIVFLMFIWLLAVPSMIAILLPINRLLEPVVTSVEVDVPVPTPRPMLLLPLVLPLSAW